MAQLELKTYLIKVPQGNEAAAAEFEQVLVQLHETLRGQRVSFELIATGQNIGFFFTTDAATAEVVAGQIYAIASDADIVEVPDVTRTISQKTQFVSAELSLVRNDLYSLKTYKDFKKDSLSGLLSVVSKCQPGEGVIVQIVIAPRKDSGGLHLVLNSRKRADRLAHTFRIKYWFKKGMWKDFKLRIEEKTTNRLFNANVRVAAFTTNHSVDPSVRLQALLGSMANFNTLDLNQFRMGPVRKNSELKRFAARKLDRPMLLSTTEVATLYHLPNEKEVPNIIHVLSKREAPPRELPTDLNDGDISFFGMTNFRNQRIPFGIKRSDRRRHLYVCGKSGTGKSKMLELLIRNDIRAGKGVCVLDPHGDLVDNVLRMVPKERLKDVVLFDPSDLEFPASFNPLEQVPEELKMRVTIGFIEIFKKLFGSNWSPRLEHVLRYTTLALLDTPGTTVLSILKMLTDKNYRQMIVRNIQDNVVKNFWVNEFAGWSEKFDNEAITPLLNKVGQFVATNMIRNIVGQPKNLFDFREMMDSQKIVLLKISKGILGEENASLLGAIAITKIYQAAMSRADIPEEDRVDFYFYVDEFHNFATDTFDEILSEARKYRLNLTIAHQFIGQLDHKIKTTVFGNVGSIVSFRVGGDDAPTLASEFRPRFQERDIINLGVREFCMKMSVDGEVTEAFSGRTLKMEPSKEDFHEEAQRLSRETYCRPLSEVKEILKRWEEGDYDPDSAQEKGSASQESSFAESVEFEEPLI